MKIVNTLSVVLFVLLSISTFAFSAWDGTVTEPKQEGGVYQITTAEEFAWLGSRTAVYEGPSVTAKLMADIYFADNKDSVNRDHSFGTINANTNLDGNGYTVYGLYTDSAFIIHPIFNSKCRYSYRDLKLKNYEIDYEENVSNVGYAMPMLFHYNCSEKISGDMIFDGKIKVTGTASILGACGTGYENGIVVNRSSIEISAGSGSNVFAYGACVGVTEKDSLEIREAVNYGSISVKGAPKKVYASGFHFRNNPYYSSGMGWYARYYKLTNYGDITVHSSYTNANLDVSGIYAQEYYSRNRDSVFTINATNYGNVSVSASQASYRVAGLFVNIWGYIYAKNAVNKGNIKVDVTKGDSKAVFGNDANLVGGLFGCLGADDSVYNARGSYVNEGNLEANVALNSCDSWDECTELNVGGVAGRLSGEVYNAINLGNLNVVGFGLKKDHEINVGGIAGFLRDTLTLSANFGAVTAMYGTNVGGLVGYIDDGDLIKTANFGPVSGTSVEMVGGLAGSLGGTCFMDYGHCYHESHSLIYNANYADVYAYGKVSDAAGIITSSYTKVLNSFNSGKVMMQDSTKTSESLIPGRPISKSDFKQSFYDWDVFGAQDSIREWDVHKKRTVYMQSDDFVKDLNFVDSTNSDVKVWKLNPKINPYPIVGDLEDLIYYAKDAIPATRKVDPRRTVAFDLRIQGRDLVISAKAGSSYAVFNMLGKKVV